MPLLPSRRERPVPAEAARLVQSVPRRKTSAELAVEHLPSNKEDFTIDIDSFPSAGWVNSYKEGSDRPGIWGLGFQTEAWISSWWQTAVSPWLSTPAGLAVANKIAHGIARIPLRMRNTNTDEVQDPPRVFKYPLGDMYNPSYTEYTLKHDAAYNLNRFGMLHMLMRFDMEERDNKLQGTNMIRVMDSSIVQTCGTFVRPTWKITAPYGALAGSPSQYDDEDLPKISSAIYPDGRRLMDRQSDACEWGMMFACVNRLPGTNVGAPHGLMVYNATIAATEAQKHASEFFRDGTSQQLLLSPHAAVGEQVDVQATNESVKQRLAEDQRSVITPIPYDVKMVGYSAEDSQLVESRELDMGMAAIAQGMPSGPYRGRGGSYAQAYVDYLQEKTALYPIASSLSPEFTRALPLAAQEDGWIIEFDESVMAELDPKTTAEILTMLAKGGHIDTDEVRVGMGHKAYNKDWSDVPLADGNRRPVDKLAEIADSQITKGKQSEGRPAEKPGGDPAEDYPQPPASK